MRKVALVFVLAVIAPSLVLAWLAIRSLRDQEFLLQRQQSLLYQGLADSLAAQVQNSLQESERSFTVKVSALLQEFPEQQTALAFDELLRRDWPLAQVGFVVNLSGSMVCPSPTGGPEAATFCNNYSQFLSCKETAEIYSKPKESFSQLKGGYKSQAPAQIPQSQAQSEWSSSAGEKRADDFKNTLRNVNPVQQQLNAGPELNAGNVSKLSASATEFCDLIKTASDGTLARFVDNRLNVLFWYRPPGAPRYVFGAQIALARLAKDLHAIVQSGEPALREQVAVAVLDDKAKPVALSQLGFQSNWKRPFVATEIGEALPHWEVAVYLLDPAKLTRSAQTLKITFGAFIALLLLAIAMGSWLIVNDLSRQLLLARQKTDFVSNVSHELKTPLTSIRMFSELLAEGRVADPVKQRTYLHIITAEAARLTRLINNVLDFARAERREKRYDIRPCDLAEITRETAEAYRPHLEANGFAFACELPSSAIMVNGDRDALSQVLVNLLSNAEKYFDSRKDITLRLEPGRPGGCIEVSVLDRGLGVPPGLEQRIFEQFYRAHDSLSSGIPGSGLGLTLARQIARAHGGDVLYTAREGGGSCFTLQLPSLDQGSPATRT